MASCFELLNEVDSLNDSQLVKKLAEYGHIVKDEFKIKEKDKIVKRKLLKHFVAKEFQNKKLNLTLVHSKVFFISLGSAIKISFYFFLQNKKNCSQKDALNIMIYNFLIKWLFFRLNGMSPKST